MKLTLDNPLSLFYNETHSGSGDRHCGRKTRNLPKRSRYYQGMIDLNSIRPGEDYNRLTESFVIFICPFDAFGRGLHRYSFEYLCMQDSRIGLGDGAKKVFLCAGGDADINWRTGLLSGPVRQFISAFCPAL